MNEDKLINTDNWAIDNMIEVALNSSDDFLKIKETLTRIGIASYKDKILYQSCQILHKRGKYYIVHFKELFALDGKKTNFNDSDLMRRNAIVKLLIEWGMCKVINNESIARQEDIKKIKIIKHSEKANWKLIPKYNIGVK